MRILITGATGYLGANLARHFLQTGHDVFLGTRQAALHGKTEKNSQWVDLSYNNDTPDLKLLANIDIVVHSAGMNAEQCSKDPVGAFQFNCLSSSNLASAAKNAGVRKFIYLSTTHVYSSTPKGCIDEDTLTKNFHPYAASRLAGEVAVKSVAQNSSLEVLIFRISNCVGLPVDKNCSCWHLIANDLCRQAFVRNEIVLKSPSNSKRDFISMTDVVKSIGEGSELSASKSLSGTFNLSSGNTITLGELASAVTKTYSEFTGGPTPSVLETLDNQNHLLSDNFIFSNSKIISSGMNINRSVTEELRKAMPQLKKWFFRCG